MTGSLNSSAKLTATGGDDGSGAGRTAGTCKYTNSCEHESTDF